MPQPSFVAPRPTLYARLNPCPSTQLPFPTSFVDFFLCSDNDINTRPFLLLILRFFFPLPKKRPPASIFQTSLGLFPFHFHHLLFPSLTIFPLISSLGIVVAFPLAVPHLSLQTHQVRCFLTSSNTTPPSIRHIYTPHPSIPTLRPTISSLSCGEFL